MRIEKRKIPITPQNRKIFNVASCTVQTFFIFESELLIHLNDSLTFVHFTSTDLEVQLMWLYHCDKAFTSMFL